MKIQDLKDYTSIPVRLINYDAKYHRVFVEDKKVNPIGNTLDVYPGEEIKIQAEGNTPQVYIAKAGLPIILKEIVPPKQKTQLTAPEKRKRKEKTRKYIVIAVCSVIISGASVLMFQEDIRGWLSSEEEEIVVIVNDSTKQVVKPIEENGGSTDDEDVAVTEDEETDAEPVEETDDDEIAEIPDNTTTEINITQPNNDAGRNDNNQLVCTNPDSEQKNWSSTLNQLKNWDGKVGVKETKFDSLKEITKVNIVNFEACSCAKCKQVIKDQNFIQIKDFYN
jgi:cytoskeletal protein RodZ